MRVLKSVGVMSIAKIMGLLYGCMGLIFAPFFLLLELAGSIAGQERTIPFAGAFAVMMPILYGGWALSSERFSPSSTICWRNGWLASNSKSKPDRPLPTRPTRLFLRAP